MIDLVAGAALVAAVRWGEPLAKPIVEVGEPRAAAPGGDRERSGRFATIGGVTEEPQQPVHQEESAREVAEEAEPNFFANPKRIVQTIVAVVLLTVAIYVLFPKIVGLEGALDRIGDGDPLWIGIALAFNVVAFAAYVALFRGVVGEKVVHLTVSESYQITMAGLAATRLFSAGGRRRHPAHLLGAAQGGDGAPAVGLPHDRLPRRPLLGLPGGAGRVRGAAADRGALRRRPALAAPSIPAALAGAAIVIVLAIALLPEDFERRMAKHDLRALRAHRHTGSRRPRRPSPRARARRSPSCAHPSSGALAVGGAVGFWAANIGILWASFHAFDVAVPLGVVVLAFFVGMVANLFPFAPGGVGAVDAGMIGAFVLFGIPSEAVFPAVLTYRVIAFWLPIPPGIIAFFQLRKTVQRWEDEGQGGADDERGDAAASRRRATTASSTA